MARAPPKITRFLILHYDGGSLWDLFKHLMLGDINSGVKFLHASDDIVSPIAPSYSSWITTVLICKFLMLFSIPLRYYGYAVEYLLNFYYQNDGILGIIFNPFSVKIPKRGTKEFKSMVGYLDPRIDLAGNPLLSYKADELVMEAEDAQSNLGSSAVKEALGHRSLMDLCVMASKLAYENSQVIQNVVEDYWQYYFVGSYKCVNQYQRENDTHAFIFCDKEIDAKLIVISFRGTGPFDMHNWCADFDCSLVGFEEFGDVHVGFLEAMGLGHRYNISSFEKCLQIEPKSSEELRTQDFENLSLEQVCTHEGAYYLLSSKLKDLLKAHTKAKFVVTGHSLGGALAILFPCILKLQQETDVLARLLSVYTFGQPRIGNYELGYSMQKLLNYPHRRYFRMVYCNDLVPRVPLDDPFFAFEHFGVCIYIDSFYYGYFTKEEPTRNFYLSANYIIMRLTAGWELLRSFITPYVRGFAFRESWVSTFARLTGLVLPGVAAHSPVNYVNSVRLGKELRYPLLSLLRLPERDPWDK